MGLLSKHLVTGYVLAGGKSSRMGQDKGLLTNGSKKMVEYAIAAIEDLVDKVVIISNNPEYEQFGLEVIEDEIKDIGPLGGIYTGLLYAETNFSLFVSCDTPLLHKDLLLKLCLLPNGEVVVPKIKGKVEPLIGLYNKSCLATLLAKIEAKEYKMRAVLDSLQTEYSLLPDFYAKQVININTPSELKQWKHEN